MSCPGQGCRGCVPVRLADGQVTYYCPAIRVTLLCTVRRVDPKKNCSGVDARPTRGGGGAIQKEADAKAKKAAEARQRPGGPGRKKPRVSVVPEPPKVSAPRRTSSISAPAWLKALPVALIALFVLGVLVRHGTAITTAIHNVLTWGALLAIVAGVAFVAWSTRDADVWQAIPQRFAQRRATKAELAQQREQVRVEATRAIPIEPIADPAMQEWIERGLRTKHFDDHHLVPVKRH